MQDLVNYMPCVFLFIFLADLRSSVHGQVLEQWPNMIRIWSLFCKFVFTSRDVLAYNPNLVANREQAAEPQGDRESTASTGDASCLVRIPIEELQVSKPTS